MSTVAAIPNLPLDTAISHGFYRLGGFSNRARAENFAGWSSSQMLIPTSPLGPSSLQQPGNSLAEAVAVDLTVFALRSVVICHVLTVVEP